MASASNVAITGDHESRGGELSEPHGASGMKLLGRDSDLGAEAEFTAVGETRRGIDHYRCAVDTCHESLRCRLAIGDDGLCVTA